MSRSIAAALALFIHARPAFAAEPAAIGAIIGTVSNASTGNLLEGAKVELPTLGLSALTDHTGQYSFANVPPGEHPIVAAFSGLDPTRLLVIVAAGRTAKRDFDLSSGIYRLDPIKVAGEKEGLSAALTQQRNADNLKSVASMDALRDLPNMNATELAIRMPGVVFGNPGDEVVEVVSVRGTGPGMTSITIDGGGMSSFSAQNRNTRMTAFTGAMFEALEVVKGQTPDRSVDSLGGNINFRTRSPLSMREKRRATYSLTARMAPWFTEQVPLREAHRSHLLFNGAYQEKFAVFRNGVENLAVSVNAFYSENAFGFFRTQRDYQQTSSSPAFLWDYRTQDNFNNRHQASISTKWDFRLSPNTLLKLNLIYNDAPEPMRRQYQTRAYTGSSTTTPSATGAIAPDSWTNRVTTVRAITPTGNSTSTPNEAIDLTSTLINRNQRLRHIDLAGEHKFGPFDGDWAGLWSRTRYRTLGAEGSLVMRLGGIPFRNPTGPAPTTAFNTTPVRGPNGETGVGWILDRTQSDLYPRFIQNGGLDFTNPNNYRPAQNGLSTSAGNMDIDLIKELRGNVRYKLPFEKFSAFFKTGLSYRNHTVELERRNRRWNYIGADPLPGDPSILLWDAVKTGRRIPQFEGAQFIHNGQPVDPSRWKEDLYYHESNRLSASNKANEQITGCYGMVQGRFARMGFLGGVRREITETTAWARLRNQSIASSTAQYFSADPVALADRDYATPVRDHSRYGENFPSIHLWYDLTRDLKLRGSWTTGFARPSLGDVLPSVSVDATNQKVTVGNPNLLPEKARNWDFSAEYFLPHSGSLSIGWFHKTIRDYWLTAQTIASIPTGVDNGFYGEYGGWSLAEKLNGGTVILEGWELAYLQQFRFLPGALRGLRLSANTTLIHGHGLFIGAGYLKDSNIQYLIPRTANVGLSWNYGKFGASISWNYTSENLRTAYNASAPSRNQVLEARDLVNLNLQYQIRPSLTLTFGVANLFNAPQIYYRGNRDQMETFLMQGTTITGGIEGRF